MKRQDIVDTFKDKYPEMIIDTTKPIQSVAIKDSKFDIGRTKGIIVYLNNGDRIAYFPKDE